MKNKELKELNSQELLLKEKNLKKELFDLNYQKKVSRVEKPARFKMLRREIARILTILRERELDDERNSQKTK